MAHIRNEITQMPLDQTQKAALPEIQVGTALKAVAGPFSGFPAIATMNKEGRIRALVTIFGRDSEVEFNRADVEIVAG